jgi:hypothetical protein
MHEGAKLRLTSIPKIQQEMEAGASPNIFLDFSSRRPQMITSR